jgi:hypothetical protein
MISAAATAAASGLPRSPASARADTAEPTYRTAGALVEALAGKQISSRELVDAAFPASRRSIRRSTRSWCAISIGRAKPPTPPTPRSGAASAGRCSACR